MESMFPFLIVVAGPASQGAKVITSAGIVLSRLKNNHKTMNNLFAWWQGLVVCGEWSSHIKSKSVQITMGYSLFVYMYFYV